MKATQRIVALAGVSGAGKSTLIQRVALSVELVHLSASDLIQEQIRREERMEESSDSLRARNISDNQARLVKSYRVRAESIDIHIVLDCHTIIDGPSGIEHIPASVFAEFGLTDFLFLLVDPEEILMRRSGDTSRVRPQRGLAELAEQQKLAVESAREIARQLGIPFRILNAAPEAHLQSILDSFGHVKERTR